MRSGAGAFCPRSRTLDRVFIFFAGRGNLLPVEDVVLGALLLVPCAAARHTPIPAAVSSTSPKPIVLLRRIEPLDSGIRLRDRNYCLVSAGTTPDRNTVSVWSLSPRWRTLNTTFSPGLSFAAAFL